MAQNLSLQQLADRLDRIEKEIEIIRKELGELSQQKKYVRQTTISRADKETQRRWINSLFEALSIRRAPIGAQALQQRMSQAGLAPNELSRSLIEAREE
jgi:hypothetical protein